MPDRGLHVTLGQTAPIPLSVTLDCGPGELLALVGPSGSGKSTVLRAIAGLIRAREGAIRCNGELWFDASANVHRTPRERRVGFVFQHYGLFPHLTALENVMEAIAAPDAAARRARGRELLAKVHLSGLEDRLPRRLSGGQQQRVAGARALAREPAVLLLDEPFSAVDRSTRERLYVELAQMRKELAMPAVLVTHDLDEALLLADRMCVLSHGATLQSGVPYDVVTRPDTPQVAQLVGLKNIFRAGVVSHDRERGITCIEWRGRRLEARLQPAYAPGTQVVWTIPPAYLVLHRRDRPSRGERENPVQGVVGTFVRLGENALMSVHVDDASRPPLFLSIPMHVARRNGITQGVDVGVSLLAEGIHLMPGEGSGPLGKRPAPEERQTAPARMTRRGETDA
jgi:molybdate transport system ATP-binding protein